MGVLKVDIIGRTALDEEIDSRKEQILAWVKEHPKISTWVAVDDLELYLGNNFVKTDWKVGLTKELSKEIISKLNYGCQ